MATLRGASRKLTQAAICGLLRAGDVPADFFNKSISKLPGFGPYDPGINDAFKDMVCPEVPEPPPNINFPAPQFAGGQCPVQYDVTFDVVCENTSFSTGEVQFEYTCRVGRRLTGPIGNVILPGTLSGGLSFNQTPEVLITHNGGQVIGLSGSVLGTPPSRNNGNNQAVGPIVMSSIVRVDGLPDNCGSLPTPPGDPSYSTNLPYTDSDGIERNPPVTVVYLPPLIGGNGSLSFPIRIDGPNFSLNPAFDFGTGDTNFNLPLGDGDGGCCEPGTEPPPNLPPPEAGEEPEETRYFRALVVVSTGQTETTTATEISAGQGVSLFIPRLGTVSIRVRVGKGQFAFLPDIAIKHKRQLVVIPENFVGNGYAAQPIPGVSFELFPLYLKNYNDPGVEN